MRPDLAPQATAAASPAYSAVFSAALLKPDRETPALVSGPAGKAAAKRYNVYRNNVTVSLIDTLAGVYPAVQRITGVEFFRAMARFHIRETPPTSPLLFEYGRDFPAFIERYEYAQGMPWLADTARIERAWLDAYHEADAAPLTASDLASFPPERLADLVFAPHPATRLVRSRFAAVTIFAANRVPAPVEEIDASQAEDTLITRPGIRRRRASARAGRGRVPVGADGGASARRGRGRGARGASRVRYRRGSRDCDRGRRICLRKSRRKGMTSALQRVSSGGALSSVARFVDRVEGIMRVIALPSLVQLVLRFALAMPFWKSGILKWDGFFRLSDTAVTLFTDEFMLHLPGGPYPFPAPTVMAFLSGCAEITFPILLVLGLATRFAALGLLFMTLVVELTVPDGWPIHITWAAMALAIMAWGPGRVSLDYLIRRVLGLPNP